MTVRTPYISDFYTLEGWRREKLLSELPMQLKLSCGHKNHTNGYKYASQDHWKTIHKGFIYGPTCRLTISRSSVAIKSYISLNMASKTHGKPYTSHT